MNILNKCLVELTRDLILIPSDASRPQDIERSFEFIKNHLEEIKGIEIRTYRQNDVLSLVVLPQGVEEPGILFCGHIDVITHPDYQCYRSTVKDGRIYGPGAGDMKGALSILLELFRDLHTFYPGASIGMAITSDEERGGESGIRYLIEEEKLRCGIGMIPDGGSLNEITVEEKGIMHLRLEATGHSAHAARPWLGRNALEVLMDRLNVLRSHFQDLAAQDGDHWHPTCAVTIINTRNQTTNRVPSSAEAILDVRFTSPHTESGILSDIRKLLGKEMTVEKIISAAPTHLSPDPLYINITEEVTGQPAKLVRDDGGSDARFMCPYGIPVIVARPLVGELHSEDEWIDIDSMVMFYEINRRYLVQKLNLQSTKGA